MAQIIAFFVIIFVSYCTVTWLVPQILSWIIRRKYKLETRIGKITLLSLQDVDIVKNGFSIHIDKIGFRSSFLSSEVTKLLCLVINEVRINKDIVYDVNCSVSSRNDDDHLRPNDVSFHNQKIPPIIITFAQFLAVHIRTITAMFLRPESPEWLLHATASDVQLDGSLVRSAKTLLVNVVMSSASARLLRHAPSTPVTVSAPNKPRPASCLCEVSVALSLEVTLIAQGPLSVEKVYVTTEQMKIVINNGLYSFIQQRYQSETKYNQRSTGKNGNISDAYNLMHHFSPIIPKVIEVKLITSSLMGMKDNIHTEIDASLDVFSVKTCFVPNDVRTCTSDWNILWPHMSLRFSLGRFKVKSNKDKIISLKEFVLESKLEGKNMTIASLINCLSTVYKHKDVHCWLITNFGYLSSQQKMDPILSSNDETKVLPVTENRNWWSYLNIEISVQMFNVLSYIRLHPDFLCGFNNMKFLFTCDALSSSETTASAKNEDVGCTEQIYSSVYWRQNWICELLLKSGWGNLNYEYDVVNSPQFKKCHFWGFPLVGGTGFIKMINCTATKSVRIQAMIDMMRLEWSPPLASFLHQAYKCLTDYYLIKNFNNESYKRVEKPKVNVNKYYPDIVWSLTVSNSNVFCIAERKVCIMARIDSIHVSNDKLKLGAIFEGVKVSSVLPTKHYHVCSHSNDIKGYCLKVNAAHLTRMTNGIISIELTDEIHFHWSANLHLKLLTLFDDIRETFNNISGTHNSPEVEQEPEEPVSSSDVLRNIKIIVKGHFIIGVKVSSKRYITFSTEHWKYKKMNDEVRLESPMFKIGVDNRNIFFVEKFLLQTLRDDETVKTERANADQFTLPWNNTWEINVQSLKAVFPYEHEFSKTYHDDFLSVFKWLKLIHSKSRKGNTKMPRDLVIKIKEFLFEMSDDPFEVSLRDSYELLVDEYEESIKRQNMLDEKLANICKDRLPLPADKIEEIHASLQEISARVYIQRSRQMKLQAPVRTRLFAWVISNLQILSLTDPTISGAENVVRIMTDIDSESPWPEEGIEFTTLWCRWISVSCKEWKFLLRDFPQPWLDIRELQLWGKLVGAEQEATKRAKRSVEVELGEPYANVTIERSMTSLKFYHDLNCEVKYFSYAFGPCWEPVISQCNIAFSKIVSSSKDPSPPLPFWDKIRLIYHGRLTMVIRQLTVLLHASLDPYNTTEEMEVTWNDVAMDWTNAKFIFKGDLEVYVRTASKYDDCRMLCLPNLKLAVKLKWICLGDPNDHHSVMPCAPDKLPEYSSNQEHDSFRAFRSQNINLSLSLETKPLINSSKYTDCPVALLYGSTLRWFENLKLILSGVTRPTRRGSVFNNSRPRRLPLSRHYKKVHLSLALHRFQVHYWMSFSMQRGLELFGQRFSFSSEYMLTLVPVDDGLRHRPRAVWSTIYMTCDLNDAEVWLKSALHQNEGGEILNMHQPVEKCYFLSVGKVTYAREASISGPLPGYGGNRQLNKDDTPTHRLVVYRLKGAWTASNRDIIFALYDSFRKTQQLKKNLSTAALKGFRCSDSSTPVKTRSRSIENTPAANSSSVQANDVVVQETLSPLTKLQSGHAASMLQQLIAEAENKAVVFSDDLSVQMREQHLQGLAVCQEDDVVHKNWLIALVNSQVLLKGCETKGYVIMSAAKAEILQKIHKPVWKDRTLVSKTTWVGSLECMQYYATVSANDSDSLDENIMWLSVENIQEKEAGSTVIADLPDLPHLVGSGQSVGGVVSETVGAADNVNENAPLQLQRIVSRCKCEFFYAGYGESSIDPTMLDEVPPLPTEEVGTPWERKDKAVDAFTLMHHDLDVCTNSLQYAMILDIVNNLLLYVEPRRREAYERLQRMRFQLQLHSVQDQRKPIQQLQNLVRCLVAKLRKLEREMYLVQKTVTEDANSEHLLSEIEHLDAQMNECKEQLNAKSEELDMMLSCYKETQLSANQKLDTLRGDKPITAVRTSEICFKHAQWRLTEADGQLGIADLVLSNFLYTKVSKSDDSVEHLLELGYIRMTNLLANEIYREVVVPTEIQSNMPVARKRAVRIFCREKAPVGGISVKEHFEINVVPFTIGLTKKFYDTMFKFCFPKRDMDYIEPEDPDDQEMGSSTNGSGSIASRKGKSQILTEKSACGKKWREASFYVPIEMKDDVEKMKERAEKNKLFIYIKIPEVPVRVSYKGNKEKNLQDIRDFSLVIPTLEYHNVTWTWLDLFLAMKNDSRRVILSQAIKQKLQIKVRSGCIEEGSSPQEEDKARMLFGSRLMPSESKPTKKGGIFKIPK